jgi:hypothetical protein
MTEPAFRRMTDEEIANSDPMVIVRCSKYLKRIGRRCQNHSALMPQSMLLNEDGEWLCHAHDERKGPK